jgi:hypothetical protein
MRRWHVSTALVAFKIPQCIADLVASYVLGPFAGVVRKRLDLGTSRLQHTAVNNKNGDLLLVCADDEVAIFRQLELDIASITRCKASPCATTETMHWRYILGASGRFLWFSGNRLEDSGYHEPEFPVSHIVPIRGKDEVFVVMSDNDRFLLRRVTPKEQSPFEVMPVAGLMSFDFAMECRNGVLYVMGEIYGEHNTLHTVVALKDHQWYFTPSATWGVVYDTAGNWQSALGLSFTDCDRGDLVVWVGGIGGTAYTIIPLQANGLPVGAQTFTGKLHLGRIKDDEWGPKPKFTPLRMGNMGLNPVPLQVYADPSGSTRAVLHFAGNSPERHIVLID